jgi:hypothetical protein
VGGSQLQAYVQVDDDVVCILPEWGNWTRFTLEPGRRKFEAFCEGRRAKSEPKSFSIEPNVTYYFHVHQRMAEFHAQKGFRAPTMRISELTEIEANDLMGLEDKYEHVQQDGSKQR